jgi:S1-C subfamily serine protease
VLAAILVVVGASLLRQTPPQLTQSDVDDAIKHALSSATPKPNVAVEAYAKVRESVVEVRTRDAVDPVFRSRGAGVLLDSGGRILTSLHLVEGAAAIIVVFFDGAESAAGLAESDPAEDIAVLETSSSGRKPAILASPKSLRVGDEAIIVGAPQGFPDTLTVGVISGLGRSYRPPWRSQPLGGLIQFNAPVAAGSAGGPLVNRRGEVVGIVAGIAGAAGTDLGGIGFAVPIDAASSASGASPF